ncbi:hypothetical protein BDY17DRAFT_82789 [Neohortaea acidophila]|uniref:Uncharacterized protein n=1 Tax=Neohortaea acidophila TaxID=245834 RepID=A0A6A6Q3M4_9PEZI|nr:uncharacterized protein BDY17DRAFT_82789 [Neohortaea acidophila]KAF2486629.1 hypothetical protein BDY17DRAFT_82789 [Neohortaea acidophila]
MTRPPALSHLHTCSIQLKAFGCPPQPRHGHRLRPQSRHNGGGDCSCSLALLPHRRSLARHHAKRRELRSALHQIPNPALRPQALLRRVSRKPLLAGAQHLPQPQRPRASAAQTPPVPRLPQQARRPAPRHQRRRPPSLPRQAPRRAAGLSRRDLQHLLRSRRESRPRHRLSLVPHHRPGAWLRAGGRRRALVGAQAGHMDADEAHWHARARRLLLSGG